MEALGAAAQGISDVVSGADRTGTVLGCWSAAVALGIDTPTGRRIVSLLGLRASGVPNGVRVDNAALLADLTVGNPVLLGSRQIRLAGHVISVVREYATRVALIRLDDDRLAAARRALMSAKSGVPIDRLRALRTAVEMGDAEATAAVAGTLIGLGAGSTPGGDDVLAGLLIGWQATGLAADSAVLWSAIDVDLAGRTTALSADLLALAARGHAATEVLDVLRAVDSRSRPHLLRPALNRLLAVGHTSGADLAGGLLLGAARRLVGASR